MTTDPKIYRIVTFNVRYGSAWDGWNSWSQRKRAFCETVCSLTPSILCLQEPEYFQINEIISTVAESHDLQLGYVGVGRDDGGTQGEFSPILYDVRKFEVLRGGTFWLSETPDTPSRSFGAKLNRICSWAELRDKWRGISLVVFNLHLDADYNTVRVCQNSVFLTKIQELGLDTLPSIFCGDFNNETDGALEIKILEACGFLDTFKEVGQDVRDRIAMPGTQFPFGTWHNFTGIPGCPQIDFIYTRNLQPHLVKDIGIVRDQYEGRYPSDHFPVFADIEF